MSDDSDWIADLRRELLEAEVASQRRPTFSFSFPDISSLQVTECSLHSLPTSLCNIAAATTSHSSSTPSQAPPSDALVCAGPKGVYVFDTHFNQINLDLTPPAPHFRHMPSWDDFISITRFGDISQPTRRVFLSAATSPWNSFLIDVDSPQTDSSLVVYPGSTGHIKSSQCFSTAGGGGGHEHFLACCGHGRLVQVLDSSGSVRVDFGRQTLVRKSNWSLAVLGESLGNPQLVVGSEDGCICLYDVLRGKFVESFQDREQRIRSYVFGLETMSSLDGGGGGSFGQQQEKKDIFCSVGRDQILRVWDPRTQERKCVLRGELFDSGRALLWIEEKRLLLCSLGKHIAVMDVRKLGTKLVSVYRGSGTLYVSNLIRVGSDRIVGTRYRGLTGWKLRREGNLEETSGGSFSSSMRDICCLDAEIWRSEIDGEEEVEAMEERFGFLLQKIVMKTRENLIIFSLEDGRRIQAPRFLFD